MGGVPGQINAESGRLMLNLGSFTQILALSLVQPKEVTEAENRVLSNTLSGNNPVPLEPIWLLAELNNKKAGLVAGLNTPSVKALGLQTVSPLNVGGAGFGETVIENDLLPDSQTPSEDNAEA